LAVRDPAIATQELLKWHEKYAAGDPAIVSRELVKQQEKYTIQDPGTVKWQETYARPETAKLENGKEETKETVKLIAREKNRRNQQTVLNLGNQELSNKYNVTLAN
jgi:hypothetical protein